MGPDAFRTLVFFRGLRQLSLTLGNLRISTSLGGDITHLINSLPLLQRCEVVLTPQIWHHEHNSRPQAVNQHLLAGRCVFLL